MISAIICSRDPLAFSLVERNFRFTIGNIPCEVIRIDNTQNIFGICEAYNRGVFRAKGEVLVFLHEDVFHLEMNWGPRLLHKFSSDPTLGVVGVAGSQVLFSDPPIWTQAGRPWLFGKVVHELDNGARYFMTVFSKDSGDREVAVLDGCWMAVRRTVFDSCQFDSDTFPGFHFYDLDFCMQARKRWKIIGSTDILIKHRSAGGFGTSWKDSAQRFVQKWHQSLPTCVSGTSIPTQTGEPFFNVDLKGKAPQTTLGLLY